MVKAKKESLISPLKVNPLDLIAVTQTKSLRDEALVSLLAGNSPCEGEDDLVRTTVIKSVDGKGSFMFTEVFRYFTIKTVE